MCLAFKHCLRIAVYEKNRNKTTAHILLKFHSGKPLKEEFQYNKTQRPPPSKIFST